MLDRHQVGRAAASDGERGRRPGASVRRALEGSLKRLGTDYVDHYQLHRPDPKTPVAETLGALDELQGRGQDP